ncbi:MAG: S41 family peptidase [Oscillospiraceae bacterium]|nr:S41 family peptidase [Oscillospiraceae bacterium]
MSDMDKRPEELEGEPAPSRRKPGLHFIITTILAILLVCSIMLLISGGVLLAKLSRERAMLDSALENYSSILEAAEYIDQGFVKAPDQETLKREAIEGMIASLGDKWSYYMNAEEYAEYVSNRENSFVGIGISVTKEEGEYVLVNEVYEDSPAMKAGIEAGDMITAVEGENIKSWPLSDVTAAIKGEEGSEVSVSVLRPDGSIDICTMKRAKVHDKVIESAMLEGSVGYIRIYNFRETSCSGTIEAIEKLIDEGAEAFVFDVRYNGGGLLRELMDLLDYILPEGDIFISRDRNGAETVYTSDKSCIDLPMAVLVNENTVSAAEFFAAALREYDWAEVVGTPTTGKGYSQTPIELSDGSAIVLSTREYLTPGRVSLAEQGGMVPDSVIELTEEEDYLVYAKQLEYDKDPHITEALRLLSK